MLSLSCREIKLNLCTLEPLSHSARLLFIPVYPCPCGPLLRKQSYLGFCVNLRPVRVLVDPISSPQRKRVNSSSSSSFSLPHRALWSSSARSGSRLGQTAAERWITKSSPNLFRSTGFGAGVIRCLFFWGLGLYIFFSSLFSFFAVSPWRLSEVSLRCYAFSWLGRKRRSKETSLRVSSQNICCTIQENAPVSGVYRIFLHVKWSS